MTILQIALLPAGLRDMARPEAGASGVEVGLRAALAGLPPRAPVVVMLHGKGYRPGSATDCPHRQIFAARPEGTRGRHVSWPRRLGLASQPAAAPRGLAIGLGWDARADIWTATRAADHAAGELARLVTLIRRIAPDRPVDMIGHSLGARVMLGALPRLHAGAVGRMILLAGADFSGRARAALNTPAGRAAEVVNVMSRENDLFDFLFEAAHLPLGGDRALGSGLGDLPNAVDIQIDGVEARAGLARLGYRLPEPRLRVCHWSVYLRPGLFRFYRGLLFRRDTLTLHLLRAALATRPDPRWSRLAPALVPALAPLPSVRRGPTFPA